MAIDSSKNTDFKLLMGGPERPPPTTFALEEHPRGAIWWITHFLLILVVSGCGWSGFQWAASWYQEQARLESVEQGLRLIHRRQTQFARANQAYAGTLEELKMQLLPAQKESATLFAGRFEGKSDFIAELCDEAMCASIRSDGTILRAVRTSLIPPDKKLPPLQKDKGSYLDWLSGGPIS